MEIAIMIEGQNGLTWPRWQRIVRSVEDLGFVGLYRSDHFTNAGPPDKESLELWISLAWLAANTSRIEFGPLCTPASFRHPAFTARMGAQIDDLSDGRLTLGVGAGWQEREHTMFGFDLLPLRDRFVRFEESLEVMERLLYSGEPVSFEGKFYQLREVVLLPRPKRRGGPPLLIGGNGPTRTLPLAARYATEWNATFQPPKKYAELNARLDRLLEQRGRSKRDVRRSLMTGLVFGRDDHDVRRKLEARGRSEHELKDRGVVVGVASAVVDQLGSLESAGVQRVMLQWLDLDDLEGLDILAKRVLPHLSAGRRAPN